MPEVLMYPCLFCLSENTMILQHTKTGKPSLWCGICRTRVFINSDAAFKGLQVFSGMMSQVRDAWERGDRAIIKTLKEKAVKGVMK